MIALYHLLTALYFAALRLAAPFHPKARQWVSGRRGWRENLNEVARYRGAIWVHCASLGEFEQGRPLIEALRRRHPGLPVVLTFFSPSGYEVRKSYEKVDHVAYLPPDTPANARAFAGAMQPRMAVFIKYELWYFHLRELHRQQCPIVLASANFPPASNIYRFLRRGYYRRVFRLFSWVYAQNQATCDALIRHRFVRDQATAIVTGDTRFDRVAGVAARGQPLREIESWLNGRPCIVAGSTWSEDEEALVQAYEQLRKEREQPLCWIIAPHEPTAEHVENLVEQAGPDHCLWSELPDTGRDSEVLIVDTLGLLSRLYRYASVAYVGGGFGNGIHNCLEPAAHGVCVLFGPRHRRFAEASGLLQDGGARELRQPRELTKQVRQLMNDAEERAACGQAAQAYVQRNCGATEAILQDLEVSGILPEPLVIQQVQADPDRQSMYALRQAVFVNEQAVPPDLEYEHEEEATHFLARWKGEAVGCGRWRTTDQGWAKIERVAVKAALRGRGIGVMLVREILRNIPRRLPVYLHAQEASRPFYEALGFRVQGEAFEEAGIRHVRMELVR